MRTAKVPAEEVRQKVWTSLQSRMDPETHRVRPTWKMMMREVGVCRQRIADAVHELKVMGKIRTVTIRRQGTERKIVDFYYELID